VMEKSALAGEGGGGARPPLSAFYHQVQSCCLWLQLRGQIHSRISSVPYMYSLEVTSKEENSLLRLLSRPRPRIRPQEKFKTTWYSSRILSHCTIACWQVSRQDFVKRTEGRRIVPTSRFRMFCRYLARNVVVLA
jgi:hypothetical protein